MYRNILITLTAAVVFGVAFSPVIYAADWPQDAHDAQRSGYTSEDPTLPWTYAWSWNGADSSGGTGGHNYNAPREARIIVGGSYVFAPAGQGGLYAINKQTGAQVWRFSGATVNASAAYQDGYVYAPGSNGTLYKLNASNGSTAGSYSAGNGINKAVLLAGGYAYVVTDNGTLHKVNTSNMARVWSYSAGSNVHTPPSYSQSRDIIIFATADLNVHAVNNNNGSQKWKVKPTPNSPGHPNSFDQGWPVIADNAGVILLRMQLSHGTLYGPGPRQQYYATNSENRSYLQGRPSSKNLFALNLDNGSEKFIPAVGYGSVESYIGGEAFGVMGSIPVVRTLSDGKQVVYTPFRSSQGRASTDYRWDSHMGEMVLDNNTVSGLVAGDLRFVKMARFENEGGNSYIHITDEQNPVSAAGNFVFHAHWGASEGVRITDRSANLGLSVTSPIRTENAPAVVRYMRNDCSDKNTSTHKTSCGLVLHSDGRYWAGPGFWEYWGAYDNGGPQSAGSRSLYTLVADGLVIVQGNWGSLIAFKHSGSSGPNPTAGPTAPPAAKPGDANGDGRVDGVDYTRWLNNYNTARSGPTNGDFNNSGFVDGVDYTIWLNNYGK